jgi:hypothetical protein
MKVRETIWFSWSITLVAVLAQSLQAADGRPSQATLAAMGLGGMTILSDEEAISVRGFGWKSSKNGNGGSSVAVFGNSKADINLGPFGSAHSENGYAAEGSHFAKGANGSHAGVELKISHGSKGGKRPNGHHGNNTWGGMNGKMGPVNGGGHHGRGKHGKSVTISFKVFAGGFSFAKAH